MTTRIVLVRHAESHMNQTPDRVGGRSNQTPLTAAGKRAARSLGQTWGKAGFRPDALYASPAVRTRGTAALLNEAAGWRLPIEIAEDLQELSQGSAEGQPRERWWTPAAIAAMHADPAGHRLAPDAEDHRDVQERLMRALVRIAAHHGKQTVVAVTHGIAMRTLAWRLVGGPHATFQRWTVDNLGTLTLTVDQDTLTLERDSASSVLAAALTTIVPASERPVPSTCYGSRATNTALSRLRA